MHTRATGSNPVAPLPRGGRNVFLPFRPAAFRRLPSLFTSNNYSSSQILSGFIKQRSFPSEVGRELPEVHPEGAETCKQAVTQP